MAAFYNEIEPFAANWIEALMQANEVTDGRVERRSITELCGDDLRGYERAHFFAGIGGWDYALRLAGWPADAPVWTGSCPCQPFSAAGKGLGERDPRHLWPEFRRLISECRPPVVFGEQVASRAGRDWLAGVRADMEALGYAFGAADLCAAGVGAPHIRQRLYCVGYSNELGRAEGDSVSQLSAAIGGVSSASGRLAYPASEGTARGLAVEARSRDARWAESAGGGAADGGLADAEGDGLARRQAARERRSGAAHSGRMEHAAGDGREQRWAESGGRGAVERCGEGGVGHADHGRREQRHAGQRQVQIAGEDERVGHAMHSQGQRLGLLGVPVEPQQEAGRSHHATAWSDYALVECADGKARRVEPRVRPLAHGVSGRVGQLRGYGNAIVPQVAATFVSAFMESAHMEVRND